MRCTQINHIEPTQLDEAELAMRAAAVHFAAASCALEGLQPGGAAQIKAQQFVDGIIDLDELIALRTEPSPREQLPQLFHTNPTGGQIASLRSRS